MKADMVNGSVIGNYRIQQKLGETAEYIAYSGKTLDTNKEIILKAMRQPPALIRLALPDFQGRTTRFTQLNHPALCRVLEIVRDDQAFYVVCDVPRGQLLSTALANQGKLPLPSVIQLIDQLLELLIYLHQHKVTHSDLRPTNFYIDDKNHLQLADAGLIQLLSLENQTTAPESISALEFTAPERILYSKILGTKVDARADLYAVGVLFYMLLTGQPPLSADNRDQMIRTQIELAPAPLHTKLSDIPAPIEQIILRALEKSPERRFAAAETMRTALQRAQAPEASIASLEPSLAYLMESLQLADAKSGKAFTNMPTVKTDADSQQAQKVAAYESMLASVQASLAATAAAAATPAVVPAPEMPSLSEFPSIPPSAPLPLADDASVLEPRTIEMEPIPADTVAHNEEPVTLNDLFPPANAEAKVTLNELFTAEVDPAPPVEIDIVADSSVYVSPDRDDDVAFAELRSRTQPNRLPRNMFLAACAGLVLVLLSAVAYWILRPASKSASTESATATAPAAPVQVAVENTPTTTIANQSASASTSTSAALATAPAVPSPTVNNAQPAATVAPLSQATPAKPVTIPPQVVHTQPTPAPTATPRATPTPKAAKPVATPAPTLIAQASHAAAEKAEKSRHSRPARPSLAVEKERRKRVILESLSQ